MREPATLTNITARAALIVDLPNHWHRKACLAFPDYCVLTKWDRALSRRFERVIIAVKHPSTAALNIWKTLVRPGGEFVLLSDVEIGEIIAKVMPRDPENAEQGF